jgi:hypothetical protein
MFSGFSAPETRPVPTGKNSDRSSLQQPRTGQQQTLLFSVKIKAFASIKG